MQVHKGDQPLLPMISHVTGSFVGHSPSDMLCPPAPSKGPLASGIHTHTETRTQLHAATSARILPAFALDIGWNDWLLVSHSCSCPLDMQTHFKTQRYREHELQSQTSRTNATRTSVSRQCVLHLPFSSSACHITSFSSSASRSRFVLG